MGYTKGPGGDSGLVCLGERALKPVFKSLLQKGVRVTGVIMEIQRFKKGA